MEEDSEKSYFNEGFEKGRNIILYGYCSKN